MFLKNISISVVMLVALGCSDLFAEVVESAPEAKGWFESLASREESNIKGVTRLVWVDGFKDDNKDAGLPTFQDFDFQKCVAQTFIQCVSPVNAKFAIQINDPKLVAGIKGAALVTGSDSVLYAVGDKVFVSDAQGKESLELRVSKPQLAKTDPVEVMEAVLTAVGYDGVVLDRKGDFLLVGTTSKRLKKPDIQALSMANSENMWSLANSERKGSSLLALINQWNGIGVFQQIVADGSQSTVNIGAKIILETK